MRVSISVGDSGPGDSAAEPLIFLGELRPPQAQLLLAFLIVERRRAVPRSEVTQVLWGDDPPAAWGAALRGLVARVRAFLVAHDVPAEALGVARGQFRLILPADWVTDVEHAAHTLGEAERALAAGDADRSADLAAAAGAVFARPLSAELPGDWAARRRAEQVEWRARALETLAAARRRTGEHPAAIAAARQAWALLPLREASLHAVIAAHHAAGDRVAALEAYHRGRRRLRRELGIEPSGRVQAIFLRLLRDELDPGGEPVPAGRSTEAATEAATELAALRAALVRPAGAHDAPDRAQTLLRMGTLLRRTGVGAEAAFGEAAAIARMHANADLLARVAAANAAFDRLAPHAPGRGLSLVEEALDALPAGAATLRAVLLSRRVQYLTTALQPAHAALVQAEAAAARAGPDARPWALTARLHATAGPCVGPGRVALAAELAAAVPAGRPAPPERAADASASAELELRMFALEQRAWGLTECGDLDAARAALAEFAREAADCGVPFVRLQALLHRGFVSAAEGRFSECEQAALEVGRVGEQVAPSPVIDGVRSAMLHVPRWLTGRTGDLLPPVRDIQALLGRPESGAAIAFLGAHSADPAVGRAALDAVPLSSIGPTTSWSFTMFNLVGASVALGDRDRCGDLYDLLTPCAEHTCAYANLIYLGSFHVHLGRLARILGRTGEAIAHQEAALARHETARAGPWSALAAAELAASLRRRDHPGDADRAAQVDGRAATLAAAARMVAPAQLLTSRAPV